MKQDKSTMTIERLLKQDKSNANMNFKIYETR